MKLAIEISVQWSLLLVFLEKHSGETNKFLRTLKGGDDQPKIFEVMEDDSSWFKVGKNFSQLPSRRWRKVFTALSREMRR